jgi:outer membrane immunogenic protein
MGSSLYRRGVVKKSIFCLSALLALSATGALAEEMASPPSAFVTGRQPYLSWTGVYAGINGGYTWSNPNVSYVANDAASIAGTCAVPGGLKCIPTADFKRDGGLFGGQVGFNWQFNTLWLAGVEADYQWSDFTGTGYSPFHLGGVGTAAVLSTMAAKETVGSFGTLRARLGALPFDSLLLYGTGGLAVGQVKSSFSLTAGASGGLPAAPGAFSYQCTAGTTCFAGSSSQMLVGWAAGGGAELAITSNLTFKGEALYVHLEQPSATVTATAVNGFGPAPSSFTGTFGYVYFIVARGGLNYRF